MKVFRTRERVPRARLARRGVATLTGILMMMAGLTAVQPAHADTAPADPDDPATPVTVAADALPAPQINGVVWSQAMVGNTVYVGGSFSNARPAGSPAGQNTVTRNNMLAFNVTTGQLTSFAPSFNGQINAVAVSPDKTRVYVGGEFTSVNGQTRRRLAAFDAQTGALISNFAPPVNYDVDALVATNTKVYAGGSFLGVGSQDRQYLAAFNASNGALLDWAPQATGGTVSAITINPEGTKVVVGGSFTKLNGSSNPGYGLGMVDAVTGANLPFEINSVIRNGTADGAITSLSSDADYVYGGGYTYGKSGGTFEGTFSASWDNGKINFINDCHGDTYSVQPVGDVVYQAGHSHYCDNIDGPRQGAGGVGSYPYFRATAMSKTATGTVSWEPDQGRYYSFLGQPAPSFLHWYPDLNTGSYTGQYQGPWSVTGNSDYMVYGGEFTRVNGTSQQGLVRFAVKDIAPNNRGPELFNSTYPLNVSSTAAGSVRINWQGNVDDDNENLTYKLYRDTQNAAGLIRTVTKRVRPWETITMSFTDTGLAPGSTHQYRVQVSDPFGNVANSPWTSVTVATSGTDSAYVKAVYDSEPSNYWRLGDPSGAATDRAGFLPLTPAGGVTRGATGGIANDSDKAFTFNGTNTGWAAPTTTGQPPDEFTLETWFKTTRPGGRMIGWSNRLTQGSSSKLDRHIYLDTSGRVNFGAKPAASRLVVTSPTRYDNGSWHHAVGTMSKDGIKLYLDGQLVGSRTDVTVGEHLSIGNWRIGGDSLSNWPNAGSSTYFNGQLDEVAVYKRALPAGEVARHYAAGTGVQAPNEKPTAAFQADVSADKVSVDASSSSDPDGTIESYAWDFGDGKTGTGKTTSHTYDDPGTYQVKLTVTDDRGDTDQATRSVTIAANQAPEAAFDASVDGSKVSVDASDSADPDGSIASYAWEFGDGEDGSGKTASHTYDEPGEYQVKLTVTDDRGATDSATKTVTIEEEEEPPAGAVLAEDKFSRSVSNGWGSADTGGAWSRSGSAGNFAVAGGVGTIRMGSAGSGPSMALDGVSSDDTEVTVSIGLDKPATGGGVYTTVRPRIMANGDRYFADVRWVNNGSVSLILGRNVGSSETTLQTRTVTGLTVSSGDRLNVRVQATGTSPTTFRAKVWKVGTAEPSDWIASVTDSASSLQGAGAVGLGTYLSGSATNAPVTASFDNFWAGNPGAAAPDPEEDPEPEPEPNQAPEAAFDASVDGSKVSVDASDSADPDGSIASYAWEFGDGEDGSGKTASHTYDEPGEYQVKLTVTDDRGATDSATKTVTIEEADPPADGVLAEDDFSRTVSDGWGSAETGGDWTRTSAAGNYAVAGGVGTMRMSAGGSSRSMTLNSVSSDDTEARTTIGLDKAATGGGVYTTVRPRVMSNGDRYYADVRWLNNGSVSLILGRNVGSSESVLQSRSVSGLSVAAGDRLNVRVQATGTSPTTFRAKVWKVGTSEPSGWIASVTDSTSSLQEAGAVGVATYLSGSATNAPVIASFDNFWAGRPAAAG